MICSLLLSRLLHLFRPDQKGVVHLTCRTFHCAEVSFGCLDLKEVTEEMN